MENEITTISIRRKTKDRLDSLGKFKEGYDDLLNRILDIFELKSIDDAIKSRGKR